MEQYYRYVYEVKFKNGSYEYITGNAEFYRFLKDDFFITFDSLLTDSSKKVLEKIINYKAYNVPFVLEFFTGEREVRFMVAVITGESTEDRTVLRMIELDRMYEDYHFILTERQEDITLLAQLDSIYYSYEVDTGIITCFLYREEKKVISQCSLQEWEKDALESLPAESRSSVEGFVSNLKNGIRNFIGTVSVKGSAEGIDFSGAAIYNDDVHVKTVGVIGKSGIKSIDETARRDQLTGLYLKEDITNYAKRIIDDLKHKAAMAIIDIDDFKNVNDHWGHSTGDKVLRKCAAIIAEQLRGAGKAGRIGGDEFFIVIDNFDSIESIKSILRGIKNNIAEAYSDKADGFHVTTSIGLTVAPDDADNFGSLYNLADHMLYLAKNKGKNRYIIYEPEKHGSVEDILQTDVDKIGIISRRGLSKSEAVCQIQDLMLRGKTFSAEDILNSIVKYFGVERIMLFNKTDREVVAQGGSILPEDGEILDEIDYVYDERLNGYFNDDVMVVNNIKNFRTLNPDVYENFFRQGIRSIMQHRIVGKNGKDYVISYESVSSNDTWHLEDMYLYRLLNRILVECL
ncbi:MAG: GGDEF domain-containing protein [Firmicutes bacterium]|nr:GGDEF domain-containing protein [[Eubacterium] siraeum]MCM1489129.1 GGDEF domain-containing protein [Bacillota bacterium]